MVGSLLVALVEQILSSSLLCHLQTLLTLYIRCSWLQPLSKAAAVKRHSHMHQHQGLRGYLQSAIREGDCCKVPAARQLHSRAPKGIPPQMLPVTRAHNLALCAALRARCRTVGCLQRRHRLPALCRQLGALLCKYAEHPRITSPFAVVTS